MEIAGGVGGNTGFTSPRLSRYVGSPTSERPPISNYPSSSSGYGAPSGAPASSGSGPNAPGGAESWKRAAEVTQNLKARIEMMKVSSSTACSTAYDTDLSD